MDDDQISNYLDYWMDNDPFFNEILSNNEVEVQGVEYYNDKGYPRSAVNLDENLILLFPPYQTGFNYSN